MERRLAAWVVHRHEGVAVPARGGATITSELRFVRRDGAKRLERDTAERNDDRRRDEIKGSCEKAAASSDLDHARWTITAAAVERVAQHCVRDEDVVASNPR